MIYTDLISYYKNTINSLNYIKCPQKLPLSIQYL
jgi:hypothetical protein